MHVISIEYVDYGKTQQTTNVGCKHQHTLTITLKILIVVTVNQTLQNCFTHTFNQIIPQGHFIMFLNISTNIYMVRYYPMYIVKIFTPIEHVQIKSLH